MVVVVVVEIDEIVVDEIDDGDREVKNEMNKPLISLFLCSLVLDDSLSDV